MNATALFVNKCMKNTMYVVQPYYKYVYVKKTYLRYFGTDAGKNAIYSKR